MRIAECTSVVDSEDLKLAKQRLEACGERYTERREGCGWTVSEAMKKKGWDRSGASASDLDDCGSCERRSCGRLVRRRHEPHQSRRRGCGSSFGHRCKDTHMMADEHPKEKLS